MHLLCNIGPLHCFLWLLMFVIWFCILRIKSGNNIGDIILSICAYCSKWFYWYICYCKCRIIDTAFRYINGADISVIIFGFSYTLTHLCSILVLLSFIIMYLHLLMYYCSGMSYFYSCSNCALKCLQLSLSSIHRLLEHHTIDCKMFIFWLVMDCRLIYLIEHITAFAVDVMIAESLRCGWICCSIECLCIINKRKLIEV